jgi:hypothetical protein
LVRTKNQKSYCEIEYDTSSYKDMNTRTTNTSSTTETTSYEAHSEESTAIRKANCTKE